MQYSQTHNSKPFSYQGWIDQKWKLNLRQVYGGLNKQSEIHHQIFFISKETGSLINEGAEGSVPTSFPAELARHLRVWGKRWVTRDNHRKLSETVPDRPRCWFQEGNACVVNKLFLLSAYSDELEFEFGS